MDNGYIGRPAQDFLDSLRELFEEVGRSKFNSKDNFKYTRRQVTNFLSACAKTTGARARATNPVTLPDGSAPKTMLPLPPSWLKVDDKERTRLDKASNDERFMSLLERIAEKKGRTGSKRPAQAQLPCPAKRIKMKSNEASSTQDPISTGPSPADQGHSASPGLRGTQNSDSHASPSFQEEQGAAGEAPEQLDRSTDIDQQPEIPTTLFEAIIETPADETTGGANEPLDCPKNESRGLEGEGNITTGMQEIWSPQTGATSSMTSADAPSPLPVKIEPGTYPVVYQTEHGESEPTHQGEANEASTIPGANGNSEESSGTMRQVKLLAEEIMGIPSSSWEGYKPVLLDHIQKLGLELATPSTSLDPEISDTSLKRLNAALANLDIETAVIPKATWESYHTKLVDLYASSGIQAMNFAQRLSKIGKIIYLDEEEAAIAGADWTRLRSAVSLCAILAEITGPESEEANPEQAERWMKSKLRDIAWLEKVVGAKIRARATAESVVA